MVAAEPMVAPARRNFLAFLWGMLWKPRASLEVLRQQTGRSWLLMAILSMLAVVGLALVTAPISARQAQEAVRASLENRPGAGELTPEMKEQAVQGASNPLFTMVMPIAGGLAGLWLSWLVWAGGLHLGGTMLGGSGSFRQMFRAVVWCWLPFALRRLLQAVFIAVTQETIANPGFSGWIGSAASDEGMAIAPPTIGELLLRGFLGQVDIFMVWALILTVIAVSVTARISTRKAVAVMLVVWLVISAASLLPSLASGAFAGSISP